MGVVLVLFGRFMDHALTLAIAIDRRLDAIAARRKQRRAAQHGRTPRQ